MLIFIKELEMKFLMIPLALILIWSVCAKSQDLIGVQFIDANTAVAVGQGGAVVRSADKGITWTAQNSGISSTLNGVSFAGAAHGFATGFISFGGGQIYHTSNAGTGWTLQSSSANILQGVSFQDTGT